MKILTIITIAITTLATNYCVAQSKGTKPSTQKVFNPCEDSATKSAINLYLIKGAEARELLNECQKNRVKDSIDRAECNRLLAVEEEYSSNLSKDMAALEDKVRSLRLRLIGTYVAIGVASVVVIIYGK